MRLEKDSVLLQNASAFFDFVSGMKTPIRGSFKNTFRFIRAG